MRIYSRAALSSILLLMGMAVPSVKADAIYDYTGSTFTLCTYGPCPANYTSDYLIASISFSAPLGDSMSLTDELPTLTGWTIGDALGNFFYSSSNPSTQTYLTGFPANGAPALALSTDINGNIVDSDMSAFPAEVLGIVGASEAFIFAPAVNVQKCNGGAGCVLASGVEINWGLSSEWDAISSTASQWTEASAAPEPSTTALVSLGVAILLIAMSRKRSLSPL
jgi:hypothetical protein